MGAPEALESLTRSLGEITRRLKRQNGEGRSVLIVEDDGDGRQILAAVLRHAGYTVVSAKNGQEALAKLKQVIPSLIVMDLRMPVMDGWALDRALRASPALRTIPVVVVSAFAQLDSARIGVHAEAWLEKPIDLEAFLELIPRVTARRRSFQKAAADEPRTTIH